MRKSRLRYLAAAVAAFLIGVPLTERAVANGAFDIVDASLGLAAAIVNSVT